MSTPYAVARLLDPNTGEPSLGVYGDWALSPSPACEMVKIALRTQLGACIADPSLGVDWSSLDTLRTTAPADAQAAITAGLIRYVRAGAISNLTVTTSVNAARGSLRYTVTFVDVLLRSTQEVIGSL